MPPRTGEIYYRWTCKTRPLSEEVLREPLYNVWMFGCVLAIAPHAREWAVVEDDVAADVRRYYVIPRMQLPDPGPIEVLAGPLEVGDDDLVQFYSCGMVPNVDRRWARVDGGPWTQVAQVRGRYYYMRWRRILQVPPGTGEMVVFTPVEDEPCEVKEWSGTPPEPEPESEPEPTSDLTGSERPSGGVLPRDPCDYLHPKEAAETTENPWSLAIRDLYRDPLKHLEGPVQPDAALVYVKAFGALRDVVYDEVLPALHREDNPVTGQGALQTAMMVLRQLAVVEGGSVVRVQPLHCSLPDADAINGVLERAYRAAYIALHEATTSGHKAH